MSEIGTGAIIPEIRTGAIMLEIGTGASPVPTGWHFMQFGRIRIVDGKLGQHYFYEDTMRNEQAYQKI